MITRSSFLQGGPKRTTSAPPENPSPAGVPLSIHQKYKITPLVQARRQSEAICVACSLLFSSFCALLLLLLGLTTASEGGTASSSLKKLKQPTHTIYPRQHTSLACPDTPTRSADSHTDTHTSGLHFNVKMRRRKFHFHVSVSLFGHLEYP